MGCNKNYIISACIAYVYPITKSFKSETVAQEQTPSIKSINNDLSDTNENENLKTRLHIIQSKTNKNIKIKQSLRNIKAIVL